MAGAFFGDTPVRGFGRGLRCLIGGLLGVARSLLQIVPLLRRFVCDVALAWRRRRQGRTRNTSCIALPASILKRADPLLYSQFYLLKRGLAVTWDNPDIEILAAGVPVPAGALTPDTEYEVRVRVWNGAFSAAAVDLPVRLMYLSFGAGTERHAIGTQHVDLGVRGSATAPAFASFRWRTPQEQGHYCLQAHLDWAEDANPDNNVGQKNVDVVRTSSPATASFTVRNSTDVAQSVAIEVDTYRIPHRPPCPPMQPDPRRTRPEPPGRLAESRARWAKALTEQGYGKFPVDERWRVHISPLKSELLPGQAVEVRVIIEPIGVFAFSRETFNFHVLGTRARGAPLEALGGVTLHVEPGGPSH